MNPPLHKCRPKVLGDRVKIPRHPADESRGFHYGTIIHGRKLFDGEFIPEGPGLIVEWDEHIPYLGSYSDTFVAISNNSQPEIKR
jgi:hypothetical protein